MTDKPYKLDYFSSVVDVKFDVNWLVIFSNLKTPPSIGGLTMSVDVSFPDQSGGTPGFNVITASVPLAALKPAPYQVTAASMIATLTTLAGAGLTGFGVRGFTNDPGRGPVNAALYIKLDNKMPSSPFRVRVHYITSNPLSGSGDGEVFTVTTLRNMKRAVLSAPLPDALGTVVSTQAAVTETDDHERTFDFLVHPDTLQVDEPTG